MNEKVCKYQEVICNLTASLLLQHRKAVHLRVLR